MNVYVVVAETYPEDHQVLGVFSSKEAADKYIDNEWRLTAPDSSRPEVEECEVID